jgi:hypothetical protein
MASRKPPGPGTYGLSDEPPPKRRYRPMPGVKASSERPPEEPKLRQFFGLDPFPWVLAVCVLVWVGLGLASRLVPAVGLVLMMVGFAVIVLSQMWLYLSIFEDDQDSFWLSLISGWYRIFYLYLNPEIAWRPGVLAGIGILMVVTGVGMYVMGIQPPGP